MNWIILIIAGLCETGFAFCLGKTKLAVFPRTSHFLASVFPQHTDSFYCWA